MTQSATKADSRLPGYAVPILFFKISGITVGTELHWVREIVTARTLTPVPNANDFVSGVVNIRGEVISVLDTSSLCLGRQAKGHTRIILLDTKDAPIGLAVESVISVNSVLPESFTTPSPEDLNGIPEEYISGITIFNNRRTALLHIPAVLQNIQRDIPHLKEATE